MRSLPPLPPGPLDETPAPERLAAHVVTPGPRPRIHGYSVEDDLARYHGWMDTLLLALTGELPDRAAARAAELALVWASPVSAAEAPVHAAILGRICGARDAALLGLAAVTLAEQAQAEVRERAPLLAWLDHPEGPPPPGSLAGTAADREAVGRVREAVTAVGVELPALAHDLEPLSAALALWHRAGVRERAHLELLLLVSRLPCTLAEALAQAARGFRDYPTNLPRFRYEEGT